MRRRTLLGLAGLTGLGTAVGLAGCGEDEQVTTAPGTETLSYGTDPSQYAELTVPDGEPRGLVVVIHGGFWKSAYDLDLGRPLARDLVGRGWAALNVEYRRVGNGGGVPATLDDVRAAIDMVASEYGTVVTLGHSAGGHLATWAGHAVDTVTHVISQAGVLDLVAADRDGLGGGAVRAFLGAAPIDDVVDPMQQVPLAVPVWCVHGTDDDIVPVSQSQDYVAAATAAGGRAELVEVAGDHFVVIDTGSQAWTRTVGVLDEISPLS